MVRRPAVIRITRYRRFLTVRMVRATTIMGFVAIVWLLRRMGWVSISSGRVGWRISVSSRRGRWVAA